METNQKNQDESALALILVEVKKLTKYFKLDRKSKSHPDDLDGAENPDESERLLQDLLEKVSEIVERKDFSAEQVAKLEKMLNAVTNAITKRQGEHHQELESTLERIEQALNDLKTEKQDNIIDHRHCHAIDIVSSKVFLSMVGMGLTIFLSLVFHIYQLDKIRMFRDNDLKYRCVKMHGGATSGDIKALETIFTYGRNSDSIRLIRRQVIQYERLVKEQAEKIEQARLNASEAQRLQNQAETVKGGK